MKDLRFCQALRFLGNILKILEIPSSWVLFAISLTIKRLDLGMNLLEHPLLRKTFSSDGSNNPSQADLEHLWDHCSCLHITSLTGSGKQWGCKYIFTHTAHTLWADSWARRKRRDLRFSVHIPLRICSEFRWGFYWVWMNLNKTHRMKRLSSFVFLLLAGFEGFYRRSERQMSEM